MASDGNAFAMLEIPNLDKMLPVVEGTSPKSLEKGVGHLAFQPIRDEMVRFFFLGIGIPFFANLMELGLVMNTK